jgi:hypothetical protein
MGRVDRIRQNIVAKIVASEGWWEGNILQTHPLSAATQNLIETHLLRQTMGRRRRHILLQLMDLSNRDLQD